MMSRWLVALALLSISLAGCLEQSGGGPETPPPETTDVEPGPVTSRDLSTGSQSGAQGPVRRVISDETEWAAFWSEHGSNQLPPPEKPDVDFTTERVIAAVLGDKPNTCWSARITGITRSADGTIDVEVTTYSPPPETMCGDAITRPYDIVAIATRTGDVTFIEKDVQGPPAEVA